MLKNIMAEKSLPDLIIYGSFVLQRQGYATKRHVDSSAPDL
jgi:hypothetical protein